MDVSLRWDKRATSWWSNRLRAKDSHPLTIHNVYVLPTRAGWMMLVTMAVLMLATINYQLNLGYVLIFLWMGAGLVGLFLAHRALTRMTFELVTAQELRGKVGETLHVPIRQLTRTGRGVQTTEHKLALRLASTGQQLLPRVVCETRYPLGLLRLWSVWRPHSLIRVEPPDAADAPSTASYWAYSADTRAGHSASEGAMRVDIRAFKEGDTARDVLWKTVAKRPDTPSSWGVRTADPSDGEQALAVRMTVPHQSANDDDEAAKRRRSQWIRWRDLILLGVLFLIVLPFFQHLVWWYPLLACSLIAWRWWQIKNRAFPSPKWLQLPLVLALGAVVWLHFRSLNGIEMIVSVCVGLLGIKALELPDESSWISRESSLSRDHWVLTFFGLFILSAHFLVSQSLTSSVQVVLGLAALIHVLVMSHMQTPAVALAKPQPWLRPLRVTFTLIVVGMPFMALMFFLFPRFAPLWSLQEQKMQSLAGLTSQMRIGDIDEVSRDNRIVFRLQMESPPNLESRDIYLRAYALTRFDGRTWASHLPSALGDERTAAKPKPLLDAPLHAGRRYTLIPDEGKPYQAVIAPDALNDAQSQSAAYLRTSTSLPSGSNPRTSQWLQGLQADTRFENHTTTDWSNYFLTLLRTGGYQYTLSPGNYGVHVVDELLFDRKLGFCEHYASAYVVAMRTLGIPARVVTGYQGAEINPIDGMQVVRNSNAHAWAEYWGQLPPSPAWQWIRVDPTAAIAPARIQSAETFNQAPQRLTQQGRAVWTSALMGSVFKVWWRTRQSWEATNYAWEAWFASYNQASQINWLKRLGIDVSNWRDLVQLLNGVLLLLFALSAAVYLWQGRRGRDPWLALMQRLRDQLARQGLALPDNATPLEIAQALPNRTPRMLQWLMALEAARYAPLGAQQTKSLSTLKRQLPSVFKA